MHFVEATEPLVHWPLGEHLAVGLVEDEPGHLAPLTESGLLELGISADEALAYARKNLAQRSQGCLTRVAAGLYASPWQDEHDAARILIPHCIEGLPLAGEPVLMVPHRDHLIAAGADDPVALAAMLELSRALLEAPDFVSSVPLVCRDGSWIPFCPGPEHPLHEAFAELRVAQLVREHAQQRGWLEARLGGQDVFVASFRGVETQSGLASYCVWSRGVPSLLPRAELVAVLDPDDPGPPLMVRWDDVMDIAGEALIPLEGTYPPRYRTRAFPAEPILMALRERNVDL